MRSHHIPHPIRRRAAVKAVAVVNIITGKGERIYNLRLYDEVGVFDADLVFLEAVQTHRAGSGKQSERSEHIGFEKVTDNRRLIQVRFDEGRYFGVGLGQLAPMNAGLVVMGRMISVVEHHEIREPAGEVTGVIIIRLFICVYVLDIIEDHNNEECYLLGDDDKIERFAPVQDKGDDDKKAQGNVLNDGQDKFLSFVFIETPEMVHDRALLEIAADGRVGKEGKDVVGFAETVGNGEVSFPVVKLMVILIMGGGPGKSGKSIEQGNPIIRDMIEEGRFPHRHVVVVVGYYGYCNGHIQGQNEQRPVKTDFPLNKKEGGCQGKIDQGFNVRRMFEHMAKR
jgi:hypothetical protein